MPAQLRGKIGRRIQQRPGFPIPADREARLGATFDARVAPPRKIANAAAAVPLREAAARRGPENDRSCAAQRRGSAYIRTSSSPDA